MNCPSCLSIMSCQTEIINVSDNLQRMDLHCHNKNCSSAKIHYRPHVGVFVRPNEKWECINYNLPFQYRDRWYALTGKWDTFYYSSKYDYIARGVTSINTITNPKPDWVSIPGGGAYNRKGIALLQSSVVRVGFVSISTGDDMHLEANKLFTRLMNLVVFT